MSLDVKVGDQVRVYDVNGKRMGMPEGGWEGVVTKVGRKLFTVDYPNAGWLKSGVRGSVFRLEAGQLNDKQWAYHTHVLTLEQAALKVRLASAREVLRDHGLIQDARCDLTLEQFEALAKVLTDGS